MTFKSPKQAVDALIALVEQSLPSGLENIDLERAADLLSEQATLRRFQPGETLVQSFTAGSWFYLLLDGSITFWSNGRADRELVTTSEQWTPFGWSALRSPSRYFSHVTSESEGQYLALSIDDIQSLSLSQPLTSIALLSCWFARALPLVKQTRADVSSNKADIADLARSVADEHIPCPQADLASVSDVLERSPVLGGVARTALEMLASTASAVQVASGDYICRQGHKSPGLTILIWGQIKLEYKPSENPGQTRERIVTRPGSLVSWVGLEGTTVPSIYDAQATRYCLLLVLTPKQLSQLCQSHPFLVETLFHKQFWMLGRSLRSARALKQLENSRSGIEILKALIDDNRMNLHPSSQLFAIEAMLQHTATRPVAFDLLNRLPDHGSDLEKGIATLALDTLRNLELETSLASALALTCPDPSRVKSPSLERRTRHAEAMEQALDFSGFQISGLENLPDSANCLFIYNSLPGREIAQLANGQNLDLCAEFISAKVIYPKYGKPGTWIARPSSESASAAILGTITPPKASLNDDDFLQRTQEALAAGSPLMLAPEGEDDREWRDQSTASSPGPLRAGAFALAQALESQPLIVPVALANFDEDPADSVLSVAIQRPIPVGDLPDLQDRKATKDFLLDLRQRFKRWVAQARDQAAGHPPKNSANVWTNRHLVGTLEREFQADVLQAEQSFHAAREPQGQIMLYGSSSLRFWNTAEADLGHAPLFNLAFGGSTLPACDHYLDRLVSPLAPRGMIFYCGDNDLSRHGDPLRVARHFRRFADRLNERFPSCRCLLVSIKPSPLRAHLMDSVQAANEGMADEVAKRTNWRYVSVYEAMLGDDGQPRPELFVEDRLHLSPAGYALWAKILRPEMDWLRGL